MRSRGLSTVSRELARNGGRHSTDPRLHDPLKHSRRCCADPWDRLLNDQALHPSTEVTAADWLGPRLRRFGSAVTAVVPDGFPSYVRILHPARGAADRPVRWNGELPPDGNLPAELLRILCGVLVEHTSTTESCWFCLWDGYGWLYGSPSVAVMGRRGSIPVPPAFPAEVLDGPRVRLLGRDYLLFAGSLAAAPELG